MAQVSPQACSTDSILLATLRGHIITAIPIDGAWRIYRQEDGSISDQAFASPAEASDAYWGDEFWRITFEPVAVEIAEAA